MEGLVPVSCCSPENGCGNNTSISEDEIDDGMYSVWEKVRMPV